MDDMELNKLFDEKINEKRKEMDNKAISIQENSNVTNSENEIIDVNNYSMDTPSTTSNGNVFMHAWEHNRVAIDIAKQKYENVNKQKKIGDKIEKVATRKTNADIEEVNTAVEEQEKNIKVRKQRIKNELLALNNERVYLMREQKHRLKLQKFNQRKEKYGDLMMKYCRRKQKDEHGKMVYLKDNDGNYILNYPNGFTLFFLLLFDTIVMTLNQIMEVLTTTNKVVIKGFFILLVCLILFVEPIRNFFLGIIGIKN